MEINIVLFTLYMILNGFITVLTFRYQEFDSIKEYLKALLFICFGLPIYILTAIYYYVHLYLIVKYPYIEYAIFVFLQKFFNKWFVNRMKDIYNPKSLEILKSIASNKHSNSKIRLLLANKYIKLIEEQDERKNT